MECVSLSLYDLLECHINEFNARNKCLTAKLLKQAYQYHKLTMGFSMFYLRHHELVSKFNIGLKFSYRNQFFTVT